jgi:hypothetical protein
LLERFSSAGSFNTFKTTVLLGFLAATERTSERIDERICPALPAIGSFRENLGVIEVRLAVRKARRTIDRPGQ